MTPTTIRRALAGALAGLALGACAGGGDAAAPPASTDPADALVDHARCLRGRGMDVPDPAPDRGGGAVAAAPVPEARTPAERRALAACASRLPAGGRSARGSGEAAEAQREALLSHARCMRDHGVDYPDPRILPDGALDITVPPGSGTPVSERAHERCRHLGGPEVRPGGGLMIGGRHG